MEAVVEAPTVGAALHKHQQVEPVAVGQSLARITGSNGLDRRVGGNEISSHRSNCRILQQSHPSYCTASENSKVLQELRGT